MESFREVGTMIEDQLKPLSAFPFQHSVGFRHTDLDANKAVHNVAVADMFEEARTLYSVNRRLKPLTDPHRRVLRAVEIEFFGDAHYPGAFDIGVGVASVNSHEWVIELCAVQKGELIASCRTRFSLTHDGAPAPLPEELRRILQSDLLSAE
jgi:acyl-CoA thioester hydrolase